MEDPSKNSLANTVKRASDRTGWSRQVKMLLQGLIWLMSVTVTVGALSAGEAEPPGALVKAAKAFLAAPATNRLAEAQLVVRELPSCSLKYERDVGTGVYRAFDYSKPSYTLSTDAVLTLFGNPAAASTNGASVRLLYLARRGLAHPSPQDWFLSIETHSGRVVYSNLTTSRSR